MSIKLSKIFFSILFLSVLSILIYSIQVKEPNPINKTLYTCPMHPQIRIDNKDAPCPICQMSLTKIEDPTDFDISEYIEPSELSSVVGKLYLQDKWFKHLNIKFYKTRKVKLTKEIDALGTMTTIEENRVPYIANFDATVEEYYLAGEGYISRKDMPVARVSSPNVSVLLKEYAQLIKDETKNHSRIQEIRKQFKYWKIKKEDYEAWADYGIPKEFVIYEDLSGYIVSQDIKQGDLLLEGDVLVNKYDLTYMLAYLNVNGEDMKYLRVDQNATITQLPKMFSVKGKVDIVIEEFNDAITSTQVWVKIPNFQGQFYIDDSVSAKIRVSNFKNEVVIPKKAIIHRAGQKIVWVSVDRGKIVAKEIETGFSNEEFVSVTKGLNENEYIFVNDLLLINSQAQMFNGYFDSLSQTDISHHNHQRQEQ